jgi:methyltransferase
MSALHVIVGLVALQRLCELLYAERNTRLLKRRGATEIGRQQYPLFILLHGAWLLTLVTLVPAHYPVRWSLLVLFIGLQLMRLWVVATLGRFWTTRIITIGDAPVVTHGPYRFVRHPNYLIVIVEIATLPLAFDAFTIAGAFTLLNVPLLAWRMKLEDEALAPRRETAVPDNLALELSVTMQSAYGDQAVMPQRDDFTRYRTTR